MHKRGTANVTKAHREKPVESVADTRTPPNEILITSGGNSRNCLVSACTHVTVVLTQQNKRGIRVWRIFRSLLFGPVTIRARLHGERSKRIRAATTFRAAANIIKPRERQQSGFEFALEARDLSSAKTQNCPRQSGSGTTLRLKSVLAALPARHLWPRD